MDMKRRRDMQIAYIADQSVMEEMAKCRKILQKLNFADRSDVRYVGQKHVCSCFGRRNSGRFRCSARNVKAKH